MCWWPCHDTCIRALEPRRSPTNFSSQTWARDPFQRVGLEKWCKTNPTSAREANSKIDRGHFRVRTKNQNLKGVTKRRLAYSLGFCSFLCSRKVSVAAAGGHGPSSAASISCPNTFDEQGPVFGRFKPKPNSANGPTTGFKLSGLSARATRDRFLIHSHSVSASKTGPKPDPAHQGGWRIC